MADRGDGRRDFGSIFTVTENRAPADHPAERGRVMRRVRPTRSSPAHPAVRAVATASAAKLAAPQAEFAFPPRSRVHAITGAPSGVLIVAAKRVQPADQQALTGDLGMPERGALLAMPSRFCIASISMKASVSLPGSSGARAASSPSSSRFTFSSWRTFPRSTSTDARPACTAPGSRRTAAPARARCRGLPRRWSRRPAAGQAL